MIYIEPSVIGNVGCVYAILNMVNGREYIGSTTIPKHRIREHFNKLRTGTHGNMLLSKDYSTYGELAFGVKIIERVVLFGKSEKELLKNKEALIISDTNPYYNIIGTNREAESRNNAHRERYHNYNMNISEQVTQYISQNNLQKTFIIEQLGISYPTFKKRLLFNNWRKIEVMALKTLGIIQDDEIAVK